MASRRASGARRLLVVALFFITTACGGEPRPVAVVYDEDACSHCRMAVSDPAFAAEVVTPGGRVEYFDDIGCLVAWLAEQPPLAGAGLFVADYESGEWLAAGGAVYVRSPELPTPMGYGIAAFQNRAAAERLAAQWGGRVLTWEETRREAAP